MSKKTPLQGLGDRQRLPEKSDERRLRGGGGGGRGAHVGDEAREGRDGLRRFGLWQRRRRRRRFTYIIFMVPNNCKTTLITLWELHRSS